MQVFLRNQSHSFSIKRGEGLKIKAWNEYEKQSTFESDRSELHKVGGRMGLTLWIVSGFSPILFLSLLMAASGESESCLSNSTGVKTLPGVSKVTRPYPVSLWS